MKNKFMKKIWLLWGIIVLIWACDTEQKVIDTGVSNPYFDGTIMDYLRSNDKNWDLTVEMIEYADLTDLFEGQVDTCPEITFWAPPAYSILRFMLESQKAAVPGEIYTKIADIPKELCRTFLLKHVVNKKYLKSDIAYINKDYFINEEKQDGGTDMTCIEGNKIRAYLRGSSWAGVADVGAVTLNLYSMEHGEIPVASPDIQPQNCVVHALNYSYNFGKI